MDAYILLDWPTFKVDVTKVHSYFKAHLSSNYDGLLCNPEEMTVQFKAEVSEPDADAVAAYWASITPQMFLPTTQEILAVILSNAVIFGNQISNQAKIENMLMGITQAGMTKAVQDYLINLEAYLKSGSLYAAKDELLLLINEPPPSNLAPWVTVERLTSYLNQIKAYLGLP